MSKHVILWLFFQGSTSANAAVMGLAPQAHQQTPKNWNQGPPQLLPF